MSRLILLPRPGFDPERLGPRVRSDDVFLPLTVEGQARVVEAPHVSLEELVPYEKLCELADRAHRLHAAFAEPSAGPLVIDGIDWNQLLVSDSQLFYFRDLLLGQELARALNGRGFDRIVWVGEESPPSHLPFHAFLQALRFDLAIPVEAWAEPGDGSLGWLVRLQDGASRWAHRLRSRLRPARSVPGRCRVVAVFAFNEWQRFTEPLAAIHELYRDHLQLWYLGSMPSELLAWAGGLGLSTWSVPYPQAVDPDIRARLEQRLSEWRRRDGRDLARDLACPVLASEELDPHFRGLFTYTMAHSAQWARTLRSSLRAASPKLLLGSGAFNIATAFPYHVAKAVSLPSVALPHSYSPGDHISLASTYLACRDRLDRTGFAAAFPDDARVLYCREAANALSYRTDVDGETDGDQRIVAVLTGSPTTDGLILPIVEIGEFLSSLAAIAQPPPELTELQLVVKSHPRYDVSPLIREHLEAPNLEIFPASAPVTELLRQAWAVVLLNHYGSVVAEAVAAGRPLIFLDSARFYYPGVENHAATAGEVVHTVADLWMRLRELHTSGERYRDLTDRCRNFRDRYLRPADVTLGVALQEIAQRCRAVA